MGCPVVSTGIGVEGLPVERDQHYVEANSASDMAAAVLSLLGNPTLRNQLALNARRFIEDNISWRHAAQMFEKTCVGALERSLATKVQ